MVISLISVIQSDISVRKIRSITELPSFIKNIKEEELSLQDPFELSLYENEFVYDEKKEVMILSISFCI